MDRAKFSTNDYALCEARLRRSGPVAAAEIGKIYVAGRAASTTFVRTAFCDLKMLLIVAEKGRKEGREPVLRALSAALLSAATSAQAGDEQ
jgi:hypothetical protein